MSTNGTEHSAQRPDERDTDSVVGPAGELVRRDPWDFLPGEGGTNEAYKGSRRAPREINKRRLYLVALIIVTIVVGMVAYLNTPSSSSTRPPDSRTETGADLTAPVENSVSPTSSMQVLASLAATSSAMAGATRTLTGPTSSASSPAGAVPSPSPSPSASPPLLSIEAEASGNIMFGGATVLAAANASGGHLVDSLGLKGGTAATVMFTNVTVSDAGTYVLTFYFRAKDNLTATVWVNGGASQSVSVRARKACCSRADVSVALIAGTNTITFGNETAPCPAIDRITISH